MESGNVEITISQFKKARAEREAYARQGQQLYARVKASSKYADQDPGHPFPVFVDAGRRDYVVQGGPGGQYRLKDVHLFVVSDDGRELKIS